MTLPGFPGARIRVGTTVVAADPGGRFHASVDARGVVSLEGFFKGARSPVDMPLIELDGRRGAYTVAIHYVNDGP
jgi:hypothetical protein